MQLVMKKNVKQMIVIYSLVAVPLLLVLIFNYYPIINGFIHIFYRWDGDTIEEYVGLSNIVKMFHDVRLWKSFGVVFIFILANLVKMIPAIVAAVIIHHIIHDGWRYAYRILFIIPMIIPQMVNILLWKYFYEPNVGILNTILHAIGWLDPDKVIQWLSNESLVIPSLILRGFPWIGAFSVLVYLAGLQNIPSSIYESAKMEGANAFQVFWYMELPLIMTQIRIVLVLMIINTIRGWEFVYLFLGESGGPNGVATVPGLYIFREAFSRGYFGYGCAIGFLIFLITLLLTWINNRYVRVDK